MKIMRCAYCNKVFHSSVYCVYQHIQEEHPETLIKKKEDV